MASNVKALIEPRLVRVNNADQDGSLAWLSIRQLLTFRDGDKMQVSTDPPMLLIISWKREF